MFILFLNNSKHTFHISLRISQNLKGVLMWKLRQSFMWRQRYWQIFKSALICISIFKSFKKTKENKKNTKKLVKKTCRTFCFIFNTPITISWKCYTQPLGRSESRTRSKEYHKGNQIKIWFVWFHVSLNIYNFYASGQNVKSFPKNFFRKCDKIRSFLRIRQHYWKNP